METLTEKLDWINERRQERHEARRLKDSAHVQTFLDQIAKGITVSEKETQEEPDFTQEEKETALKRLFWKKANNLLTHPGPFEVSKQNKPILQSLTQYFTGNPAFLDCGLIQNRADMKKGLALIGIPGVGKSLIMRAFSQALEIHDSHHRFIFRSATQICSQVGDGNDDLMNQYGRRITLNLCIDDLGKEEIEKAYKYGRNPIKIIINDRWDRLRHGAKFHFTSNFHLEALKEFYKPALVDRLRDMCNIIMIDGQTYRT